MKKSNQEVKASARRILKRRVTELMHDIGMPAHIMGYEYTRYAIIKVAENKEMLKNVTRILYKEISEEYETTVSRVERAIRHAIEIAWNRGELEEIQKIFGYTINQDKGKATNSEFIAMMADKVRLEMEDRYLEMTYKN